MRRTYVRRRLVAFAVLVVVVGWGVPAAARSLAGPGQQPEISVAYVVRSGDTLWAIAERLAPGEDPRAVIGRILAANPIETGRLEPGRALVVPLG